MLNSIKTDSIEKHRFIEKITTEKGLIKHVSLNEYIEGNTHDIIDRNSVDQNFYLRVGKNIALFHNALRKISTEIEEGKYWYNNDNCFNLDIDSFSDHPQIEEYKKLKDECKKNYSSEHLIHGDIHFDNIIVNNDSVHFCDFDDICKADYRFDLSLLLFDLSVVLDPLGDWEYINRAANTLLNGYNENTEYPKVTLNDCSLLFKLLAINFFIQFGNENIDELEDGWIKRFLMLCNDKSNSKERYWRFYNINQY